MSVIMRRALAEHAVLAGEGFSEVRLEKRIADRLRYALFEVAKDERGLQRIGVFRECARARSDAVVTRLSELQTHTAGERCFAMSSDCYWTRLQPYKMKDCYCISCSPFTHP